MIVKTKVFITGTTGYMGSRLIPLLLRCGHEVKSAGARGIGEETALLPFYWICEGLPATRESARRLGLVTISQMVDTLVLAVKNPVEGVRILDVPKT